MDSKHNSGEMYSYWENSLCRGFRQDWHALKAVVNGPLKNKDLSIFHFQSLGFTVVFILLIHRN